MCAVLLVEQRLNQAAMIPNRQENSGTHQMCMQSRGIGPNNKDFSEHKSKAHMGCKSRDSFFYLGQFMPSDKEHLCMIVAFS